MLSSTAPHFDMSNVFGLQTTAFAVHTDSSNATKNNAVKKSKVIEAHGKPALPKRAALGTITNQPRTQSLRPPKQVLYLLLSLVYLVDSQFSDAVL